MSSKESGEPRIVLRESKANPQSIRLAAPFRAPLLIVQPLRPLRIMQKIELE